MIRQLRFKVLAWLLGIAAALAGVAASAPVRNEEVKVTPVPHVPARTIESVASELESLQARVDEHVVRIERLELELSTVRCKCKCSPDCCKPAPAKPAPAKPAAPQCIDGKCPTPARAATPSRCPGGVCPSPSRSRSRGFGRLNLWR